MSEPTPDTTDPVWPAIDRRRALEEVRMRLLAISCSLARRDPAAGELQQTAEALTTVVHRIEWLASVN